MTNDPRDQQSGPEFEQDLEAVRSAWSGLEKTEPPDLLNQAVLNTARRELKARRRSRPLRWLGGFATATVIVLALTIVIQHDEQQTPPDLKKTNGFMLQEDAPVARKKEMRSVAEEMSDSLAQPAREADGDREADAWIERLLLLRETRQDEKLVEELAAFREAFPDYPLPPELRP